MTQGLSSTIVEFSQDAIIGFDSDLSVTSWNHSAEKLFGYVKDEAVGKDLSALFSSENLNEHKTNFEKIKNGEDVLPFDATHYRRKDGCTVYVSISLSPVKDASGEIKGFSAIARDVTERKKNELSYQTAFENNALGIAHFALDGSFIQVNSKLCEILGYTQEELLATNWQSLKHPDEVPLFLQLREHILLEQSDTCALKKRIMHKQGHEIRLRFNVSLRRDDKGEPLCYTAFIEDISHRKYVDGIPDESELRFRNMADSAPVLIWVSDKDKLCTWVNKPWLDFTGRTMEHQLGDGWIEGVHPDDYERFIQTYNSSFDSRKPFSSEFRLQRHDGEYRWVVNRGVPMVANDNSFIGYIGSCTDITVRKEIENVREELLLRERQARAEAESANRAKDEFLAVISHELRAPLNAMYGWARILQTKREQVDAATLAHAIDIIERSARTQSKLIEDLIDTTRIRTGKLRLDMKPVDLSNLVQAAVETARPAAREKRITLAAVINTKAGIITGDPERLQQIIGNLLSNAIKFTSEGGHVSVRLERKDPSAQIFVTDTGIGIGADMLPHIFDRFYQVDRSSTTRGHGGLGLGLSLAQQLTELHGGTIQAVSAGKGQGATFIINLPLRALRGDAKTIGTTNTGALPNLDTKVSLEGIHALIVDDERDARDLVTALLEKFGAKVTPTASAAEALRALASSAQFDVVVSDISMPGEDGYSLIRKIRALPKEEGGLIPAVALTAFSRLEDRERTHDEGYNEHVAKPVEPMLLVHTILELVQPKSKTRANDADN